MESLYWCELCNYTICKNKVNDHLYNHPGHDENRSKVQNPNYQVFIWWRYEMNLTAQDILELFTQYGPVVDIFYNSKRSCFLTSSDPEFISWLVETPPPLYHDGLPLTTWTVDAVFIVPPFPENSLSREDFIKKLILQQTLEKQLDSFLRWVEISGAVRQEQNRVLDELQRLFTRFLPDSRILLYGSSASDLQIPGSDLDISICLSHLADVNSTGQKKNNPTHYYKLVKNKRPLPVLDLAGEEPLLQLSVLRKMIFNLPGPSDVLVIPSKTCPILRLNFNGKISCDIKINTGLEVENSKLVWLLTQLDPRMRPLVLLVKFWARQHNLVGPSAFSSYSLTWMVVTYIQSLQPCLLPSVDYCRRLHGEAGGNPVIIKGYDCSFCHDPNFYSKSTNTTSLENLLLGFFKYYSTFNFKATVISPRRGNFIPVESFLKEEGTTFMNSLVNIQDPFEVDRNLGFRCTGKEYAQFLALLPKAVEALAMEPSPSKPWGLAKLFRPVANLHHVEVPPEACMQEFELNFPNLCGQKEGVQSESGRDGYLLAACNLVHRFLIEVLMVEVVVEINRITSTSLQQHPQLDFDKSSSHNLNYLTRTSSADSTSTEQASADKTESQNLASPHPSSNPNNPSSPHVPQSSDTTESAPSPITEVVKPPPSSSTVEINGICESTTINTNPTENKGVKRSIEQDDSGPPHKKVSHQVLRRIPKKTNNFPQVLRVYLVKFYHRLWLNRPEPPTENKENLLQVEAAISQSMADSTKPSTKIIGNIHLRMASIEKPNRKTPHLRLLMKPPQQLQDSQLFNFLQQKLSILLKHINPE